jgi:uncharacterized protein YukE
MAVQARTYVIKTGGMPTDDSASYNVAMLKPVFASVDPGKVQAAATAYEKGASATGTLANHILSVASGLAGAWNGTDAVAAQDALRRLYATASELTRRMQQANQALSAHVAPLTTLKAQAQKLQAVEPSGMTVPTAPIAAAKSQAKMDVAAQQIMQTYNSRTGVAWDDMPDQVQQNLPGLSHHIGKNPYASTGSATHTGRAQATPGYSGANQSSPPPETPRFDPGHAHNSAPGRQSPGTSHLANWLPGPGSPASPGPGAPGPSNLGPGLPASPTNPVPGSPGPGSIGLVPPPGPGRRSPSTDVPPGDEPLPPGRTGLRNPFQEEEPPLTARPPGLVPGQNRTTDSESSPGLAEPGAVGTDDAFEIAGPTGMSAAQEQSVALGAAESPGGMAGMPLAPGGSAAREERMRSNWLPEDEDTWGSELPYAPAVIGEQGTPQVGASNPDKALGLDELQDLVDACVGELEDDRNAGAGLRFELPRDDLSNLLGDLGFDG